MGSTVTAVLLAIALAAVSIQASAQSCMDQTKEKKLHGAAENSFMKKCKKDATGSCQSTAKEKKLSGAAKDSFTKKCVKDAVGQ
jgi:hypothetical protein